jgi:hypothetical protein
VLSRVEHGRPGRVGRGRAGPGSGAARLGRHRRGRVGRSRARPWPGGARLGRQCKEHLVAARVEVMQETEKREKERAGPSTIPAYVHRVDTSADDHKQAGLHGGHGALCSSATRRLYVTYIGLKTNERNSKYERQPR